MTKQPSAFEQLMVELINRARADPTGEVDRLITSTSPLRGAEPSITSALTFFNVDVTLLRTLLARPPLSRRWPGTRRWASRRTRTRS